jgi:general secretion pathway protein E
MAMRIGEYLVMKGLCTSQAVEAAALEAQITSERIGTVLVRNGFLRQDDLINAILHLEPDRIRVEKVYNTPVPRNILAENRIVIVAETADEIFVSTLNSEAQARIILTHYYPGKRLRFVPIGARDLDEFQEALAQSQEENMGADNAAALDILLSRAVRANASDIHIEPRSHSFTVFFRLLGVRQIVHEGSLEQFGVMAAQVKDRARMDQVETRIPQDGSFSIVTIGRVVDARVATVPTVNGEVIVIRLLDPDRANVRIVDLGISQIEQWRSATNYPYGLALVCGATGSGKTTTLNATIREMDRFGRAIRTVEEPVEYRIPYVAQVNVNRIVGLDFATALRAFMRADPDVIIMGEVRDSETATLTLRAAETGHMVMATLHTGSIRGAFGRLKALDVSPLDLQPLLRGVLVQRLIRTLCLACRGAGCHVCFGSGYSGRTVVSECTSFRSESEVTRAFNGETFWPSMIKDATDKVEQGVTSVEELRRVFHSELENPELANDPELRHLQEMINDYEASLDNADRPVKPIR